MRSIVLVRAAGVVLPAVLAAPLWAEAEAPEPPVQLEVRDDPYLPPPAGVETPQVTVPLGPFAGVSAR